jgi:thiamine-phosphate pyrophosphorylase
MPADTSWPHRGLYAITPDIADTAELVSRVDAVLGAGAAWLQYRNKRASVALRTEQARALLACCRAHRVPLIINDHVALAAEIGADGVHLGGDDGDIIAARERLGPDALIGASCYGEPDRARIAAACGASYVAFGAFHPSPTKPDARRADPAVLASTATLGLPRVAIGGVTPANAGALVRAGADLVAVISGVFDAPDPRAAVRAYLDAFQEPSP